MTKKNNYILIFFSIASLIISIIAYGKPISDVTQKIQLIISIILTLVFIIVMLKEYYLNKNRNIVQIFNSIGPILASLSITIGVFILN